MIRKICVGFCDSFNYFVAFGFVALAVLPGSVFAAGDSISVTPPDIDWSTTTATLLTAFTGVVLAACGVALSVWVLQSVVSLFKRTAK